MTNPLEIIQNALKNPHQARVELDQVDCATSLYTFIQRAWHVLHPGTSFTSGWAIETMCRHLEAVTRGEIDRLLINIPPGCTKSMLVNVFWPAWIWGPGRKQHKAFISASYEKGLSTRDLGHGRDLIKSEWFQERWPTEMKTDADGKEYYKNTLTGFRKATSVGAGLTGWRGHFFIIDDPHSVGMAESDTERETAGFWFAETTPTRFMDPKKPVYVIIMQRLHEGDVSGMIIKELAEKQDWTHLCLPMEFEVKYRSYTTVPSPFGEPKKMRRVKDDGEPLPYYVEDPNGRFMWPQDPRTEENELLWPERFDRKSVDDLKAQLELKGGSYAIASQLQQRPVPRGGAMFNRGWFKIVDVAPTNIYRVCRGWDLAASDTDRSPYTVGLKLGMTLDGLLVIMDVVRDRWEPAELERNIAHVVGQDGPNVPQSFPQDPGAAGKVQKSSIAKALHGFHFHASPESGAKEIRAIPLAAQAEAGNIIMVRAGWNDAFLAEASLFPNGDYLDQIDAGSRAYGYLLTHDEIGIATTPGMAIDGS